MSEYLSVAETAKLVRAALKKAFPDVRFSVRSDRYAGGASIRVGWTDGPQRDAVDKVVKPYSGASFDGMIDLKASNYDWLYPDGTVESFQSEVGHSYGSTTFDAEGDKVPAEFVNDYIAGARLAAGSETTRQHSKDSVAYELGRIDAEKRKAAGARLVHFGADYVFTERSFSPGYRAELESAVVFLAGEPGLFDGNRRYEFGIIPEGECAGRAYHDYGSTLVWQVSQVDPALLESALAREAKRRAHNAAVRFNAGHPDRTGYYVTVADGGKVGALLGPYATRDEAEADVPLGKSLAEQVNSRAIWYAYGVTKVTMKPGADLPAGKLEHLPGRQMTLAASAATVQQAA